MNNPMLTCYLLVFCCVCTVLGEDLTWKFAEKNLEDVLRELKLDKFLELLEENNLDRELWKSGPVTLFAPSNQAFADLKQFIDLNSLSKDVMKDLLKFHLAEEEWISKSWKNEDLIPTIRRGSTIRINKYNSTESEIITLSGSPVVHKDIRAKNGLIHVLSSVMYPVSTTNAYDTANEFPECQKFLALFQQIGLTTDLRYKDSITVFIPVDKSFKKVPHPFVSSLQSELNALSDFVRYHVVSGTYHVSGLRDVSRLQTWEGSYLHAKYSGAGNKHLLVINGNSKVIRSYPVSNGVIHLIDSLLIPPASPKQILYTHQKQEIKFK